jgi:hypothetical protein
MRFALPWILTSRLVLFNPNSNPNPNPNPNPNSKEDTSAIDNLLFVADQMLVCNSLPFFIPCSNPFLSQASLTMVCEGRSAKTSLLGWIY